VWVAERVPRAQPDDSEAAGEFSFGVRPVLPPLAVLVLPPVLALGLPAEPFAAPAALTVLRHRLASRYCRRSHFQPLRRLRRRRWHRQPLRCPPRPPCPL